jgi:hypothetical protein
VHGVQSDRTVDPSHEPAQRDELPNSAAIELRTWEGPFRLTPLAHYAIEARVLSREPYWFGWQSELSPLDLALGWGRMADPSVDDVISWRQAGRWYFFHWSAQSAYRNEDITVQSANVHIIPASDNLARALSRLDKNRVIELEGELVRVDDDSGHHWTSSLSRTDSGDGSCELMYVERLISDRVEYR